MITIKRSKHYPGEKLVYRGDALIATMCKNGQWLVLWLTGRVDKHDTYAEARDNALKGN